MIINLMDYISCSYIWSTSWASAGGKNAPPGNWD